MSRWVTVLAGGSGTRFWPLSTPNHPKQFLPLANDKPLLRQAVSRLAGLVPETNIIVVTGAQYAERTRDMLSDLPPENILAEPKAASTGPALTWASHHIRQRDPAATMISVHADWHVVDEVAFRRDASNVFDLAETQDVLVTIGVVPTRPDEGYGYIVPGEQLADHAHYVERFVEKPTSEQAVSLIREGALWNCGLFGWTTARFFTETQAVAHEIAPSINYLDAGNVAAFFEHVTPVPIDLSHFERSKRVVVIPASFAWDDVGNWAALPRVRESDDNGNVHVGPVESRDSRNCIVWSPGERVALYGVEGLIVTRANGVTMVTTKARAAQLKRFVERLPTNWRET